MLRAIATSPTGAHSALHRFSLFSPQQIRPTAEPEKHAGSNAGEMLGSKMPIFPVDSRVHFTHALDHFSREKIRLRKPRAIQHFFNPPRMLEYKCPRLNSNSPTIPRFLRTRISPRRLNNPRSHPEIRLIQSPAVLLTKASFLLSGDHDGTLIVPCPP
jgi:hypothetical protein